MPFQLLSSSKQCCFSLSLCKLILVYYPLIHKLLWQAGRQRWGNFPSSKLHFLTKLHLDLPLTLRMLYLREDSGQDEGLRVLQGFIFAFLLCLHLEAMGNFSCGESTGVCGLAQMISKQRQGEREEQNRSQSRVLSFSLLTSRLNPRS